MNECRTLPGRVHVRVATRRNRFNDPRVVTERNYPFIPKPGSPSLMRGSAAEVKDEGRIQQRDSPSHKTVRPPGTVNDGQGLRSVG